MKSWNRLRNIVTKQKEGQAVGVYSVCSANVYVIEAAMEAALQTNSCVLIEATANQVDQYGGYTGMTPSMFKDFVYGIADRLSFPHNQIFLGGDHLGPLTFAHKPEKEAMEEASKLVEAYVLAGFTKIHLDTSMKLKDDDPNKRLSDEIIAKRGAQLALVCEQAFEKRQAQIPNATPLVYVIGSEVPIPGGAQDTNSSMQITTVSDFKSTVAAFQNAFKEANISDAWEKVIACVVQPGVEEKDDGCVEYDREKAKALMQSIHQYPTFVFEGHSTDYQTRHKLKEMVEDGVGILKVGPGLTYAMREALFSLAYIEDILYHGQTDKTSNFIQVLEEAMLKQPKHWQKHYHGNEKDLWIKRKFSFSDRCRYYMLDDTVKQSLDTLLQNLRETEIPLSLISQFMPLQYRKIREHELKNDPEALIKDRIKDTIFDYLYATNQSQLM